MADNGLWFKLWCASLDDADLDNLDIADFGRWTKLGAYVKQHGQAGEVRIAAPARTLCAMFQVENFPAFQVAVSRLPNVQMRREISPVSNETTLIVSFSNWWKYQGDFSTHRVRKFREMKRSRGEEKRGEEKRGEEKRVSSGFAGAEQGQNNQHPTPADASSYSDMFEGFWDLYPKKTGKGAAWKLWQKMKLEGLGMDIGGRVFLACEELEQWHKDGGQFIPLPATYLSQRRWEDELPGDRERDRKQAAAIAAREKGNAT